MRPRNEHSECKVNEFELFEYAEEDDVVGQGQRERPADSRNFPKTHYAGGAEPQNGVNTHQHKNLDRDQQQLEAREAQDLESPVFHAAEVDEVGENVKRVANAGGPEEDPAYQHDQVRDHPAGQQPVGAEPRVLSSDVVASSAGAFRGEFTAHRFNDEPEAMQGPPDYKCPRRSVPDAAQDEHNHDIENPTHSADPVAAQGNVDIVAKPGGQRDVPAAPELGQARREIRLAKIGLQVVPRIFAIPSFAMSV